MSRGTLVYLVDEDESRADVLSSALTEAGWSVQRSATVGRFLRDRDVDQRGCLVFSVGPLPMEAMEVAASLQSQQDDLPVIVITSRSDVAGVVQAIRGGAFDCLVAPIDGARLTQCVQLAVQEHDRRLRTRQTLQQLRSQMDHMTDRQRHLVGWICSNLPPAQVVPIMANGGDGNGNGHHGNGHHGNGHSGLNGRNGHNGHNGQNGNGHHSHGRGSALMGMSDAIDPEMVEALPRRLRQTLEYLLRGDSEKQIASRLGISRHTVHDYVKSLYKRMEVSSRGELLAKCLGGFQPDSPVGA